MRFVAITIFLIASAMGAHSQDYIPFPESGGRWVNTFYEWSSPSPWNPSPTATLVGTVHYCTHGADTLINETAYTKIDTCDTGRYKGAFRNFEGKVYYVPKDSTIEYILYDYSLMPGDTAFNVYYEPYFGFGQPWVDSLVVCSNVYYWEFNGIQRKVVQTLGTGGDQEWIEGIGQPHALFNEGWANVSSYSTATHCVSINDVAVYHLDTQGPCNLVMSTPSVIQKQIAVQIFPNPSASVFYIELESDGSPADHFTFSVYDYSGREINLPIFITGSTVRLDLAAHPDGIYLVRIERDGATAARKIVKGS